MKKLKPRQRQLRKVFMHLYFLVWHPWHRDVVVVSEMIISFHGQSLHACIVTT